MSDCPTLSVIVPTHDRAALLERNLQALANQSVAASAFEVLVVADSCQDDTAARVTAYAQRASYALRLLSHEARSAAASRNLGAAHACGSLLLFLDDDVVARPELVRAHLDAQDGDTVVLGYSKPVLPSRPSWFQYDARRWWEDTFHELGRPGRRFSYRDFFSGNVCLPAELFQRVHGFDTAFTGRLEDYELGVRLLGAGARFSYAPLAIGDHYDTNTVEQWLRRIRQEGMADIQIGERHPELRASLFAHYMIRPVRWRRLVRWLAFANPKRGERLELLMLRQAALAERFRLRRAWRRIIWGLREYNYSRGVAAAVGGRRALYAWLQEAPLAPSVAADAPCVDLAALPSETNLDVVLEQATHFGLRLSLEGIEVTAIPPLPGAEPLQAHHLYAALRDLAQHQFVPAQALCLSRSLVETR